MQNAEPFDLQSQIDELVAIVTDNRAEIDSLGRRADASQRRADAAETRADTTEARIDRLEARVALAREMIAELQADGVVSREHVAQLERALATSRTIGTAVGILMSSRGIGQDEAVTVLKGASQRSNVPMRDIAATIVSAGAASS